MRCSVIAAISSDNSSICGKWSDSIFCQHDNNPLLNFMVRNASRNVPQICHYFFLAISSVCGRDLSYYITYYFVYMSFCSSAIATFVVFLVGTYLLPNSQEMANNVSQLHYT